MAMGEYEHGITIREFASASKRQAPANRPHEVLLGRAVLRYCSDRAQASVFASGVELGITLAIGPTKAGAGG